MHIKCLLSCTASHVENAIVFYYIHMILHILLALAMSAYGLFVHFCYTIKLRCLNCLNALKSLTSQFSTFIGDLLARRKLCTATSRASGLATKWCWLHCDEAQDIVFCFVCVLWYIYVFMVTF